MATTQVEEPDMEWQSERRNSDLYPRHNCCIADDEDPKAGQVRILAKVQIFLGLLALCISAFMLACAPCGSFRGGASSSAGTWCTVYIMVFALMCLGRGGLMPAKTAVIFGVIGMKFSILMVILEIIEGEAAFQSSSPDYVSGALHLIIGMIGVMELVLLIGTIFSHTIWNKADPGNTRTSMSNESSKDDDIIKSSDPMLKNTNEETFPSEDQNN